MSVLMSDQPSTPEPTSEPTEPQEAPQTPPGPDTTTGDNETETVLPAGGSVDYGDTDREGEPLLP